MLRTILALATGFLLALAALIMARPACSDEKTTMPQKQAAGAKTEVGQVKIDVCSLLEKAEVEGALGVPIERVERIPPLETECVYSGGTLRDFRTLYLEIKTDAAGWFKATKKHLGTNLQLVLGLGDEAFWLGGDTNKLYVLKKGTVINIAMSIRPELGPPVEAAKAVARKALARLP